MDDLRRPRHRGCACPCMDAMDCAERRYGRDLRFLLDGDDCRDDPDFEPCGCSCHDAGEDDEPDAE